MSNVGKPPEERKWKRWSDVPLWYRVLDRFGLPTLLCIFLLGALTKIWGEVRSDWKEQHAQIIEAMQNLTKEVQAAQQAEAELRQIILDRVGRQKP